MTTLRKKLRFFILYIINKITNGANKTVFCQPILENHVFNKVSWNTTNWTFVNRLGPLGTFFTKTMATVDIYEDFMGF